MRNPFRKRSSEEQSINAFLKGMRETMGDDQETRDIYALVKIFRDAGEFKAAQELINGIAQAAGARMREEWLRSNGLLDDELK